LNFNLFLLETNIRTGTIISPPLNSGQVKIPKDKWKDLQDIKLVLPTVTITMTFFLIQISPTGKVRRQKKKKLKKLQNWDRKIENRTVVMIPSFHLNIFN